MATITFLAGEDFAINDLAGSGLGFYGAGGFGSSVRVGEYQDNTYITDATGAVQGPKVDNCTYLHPYSGGIAGSEVRALRDIPNYLATTTIRFTHTVPVKVQNAQFRIFDRVNINAGPSGLTTKVAQLIHPWTLSQPSGALGSGNTTWQTLAGSGGLLGGVTYDPPLSLMDSPGSGGWSPSGSATVDTIHDWALILSSSPDALGSKTQFGAYVSLEYL